MTVLLLVTTMICGAKWLISTAENRKLRQENGDLIEQLDRYRSELKTLEVRQRHININEEVPDCWEARFGITAKPNWKAATLPELCEKILRSLALDGKHRYSFCLFSKDTVRFRAHEVPATTASK